MRSLHRQLRRTVGVVIAATLGVLLGLVAGLTLHLRERLRAEVLQREAEAIHAVASMEISRAEAGTVLPAAGDNTPGLFAAVLESSRLRGVMAVQLFDASGRLREALPEVGPISAAARWWPTAPSRPEARYHRHGALEEVFGAELEPGEEPTRVPLLEIVVPLHAGRDPSPVLGAARYWVDGATVAAEFARMDAGLWWQAVLAYIGAAAAVAIVLAWALVRLAEANRQLAERSADLARANQELDFAARTGALGAISAHLIHGLKNPLAGLEGFVSDPELRQSSPGGEAWKDAVATTRRLRALVQEVATVLRDEAEGGADHAVPLDELLAAVRARAGAAAQIARVELALSAPAHEAVTARVANLAGLVLANLLANAIEVSPPGATIRVSAEAEEQDVVFLVADTGGGIPATVRAELFQPVRSSKRRGGGVGLAISRRLARHAGGDLDLARSDSQGTVFRLRVPRLSPASA